MTLTAESASIAAKASLQTKDIVSLVQSDGTGPGIKVGTHEGTSPCDWSLRLVPCSVYTKEIVAGPSPSKGLNLGRFNCNSPKCGDKNKATLNSKTECTRLTTKH